RRVEQAHRVTGGGIAEPREELLGHRRAADHPAALQHAHLEPGAGQVGRADQAVVAATDNEDVAIRALVHPPSISRNFARPNKSPAEAGLLLLGLAPESGAVAAAGGEGRGWRCHLIFKFAPRT